MSLQYPATAHRGGMKTRTHVFDGSIQLEGFPFFTILKNITMADRRSHSLIWDPNHGRRLLFLTHTHIHLKFSLTSASTDSPCNAEEYGRSRITQGRQCKERDGVSIMAYPAVLRILHILGLLADIKRTLCGCTEGEGVLKRKIVYTPVTYMTRTLCGTQVAFMSLG
jgi:hypothetical protein